MEVPPTSHGERRTGARREMGERLRILRMRAKLSTYAVADRIGVSRVTINGWEAGRSEPQALDLAALAELYQVSTDVLVGHTPLPSLSQQGE